MPATCWGSNRANSTPKLPKDAFAPRKSVPGRLLWMSRSGNISRRSRMRASPTRKPETKSSPRVARSGLELRLTGASLQFRTTKMTQSMYENSPQKQSLELFIWAEWNAIRSLSPFARHVAQPTGAKPSTARLYAELIASRREDKIHDQTNRSHIAAQS